MKKLFYITLVIPFIIGCSNKSSYKGQKIQLNYVENGSLVTTNTKQLFDDAFTNKIDGVYYIGDDTCKACANLKPKIQSWCEKNHANIYEIEFTKIDEEGLKYLVDATVGYYVWTEKSSIPSVYFFMQGEVITRSDEENTIKYLKEYVEVKKG